ncbi:MAG: hypothetical protein FWB91_07750 [Defluviitaleaceae bacterium]|nr:hypothetical protein [Defluviitaleaceae bacterium]
MFLYEAPIWLILTPFVLICAAAYFCAWRYHNTNDFKKSIKLYAPLGVVCALVFWMLGLPLLIGIFMVLAGLAMLMFFSNRFFYSDS